MKLRVLKSYSIYKGSYLNKAFPGCASHKRRLADARIAHDHHRHGGRATATAVAANMSAAAAASGHSGQIHICSPNGASKDQQCRLWPQR